MSNIIVVVRTSTIKYTYRKFLFYIYLRLLIFWLIDNKQGLVVR